MNCLQKLTTIATVTTIATIASATAQAASLSESNFANGAIGFGKDTKVYFEFLESRSKAQSQLGVYEKNADGEYILLETLLSEQGLGFDPGRDDANGDWLGTAGVTVTDLVKSYTFLANKTYFLGIESTVMPGADGPGRPGRDLPDVFSDMTIASGTGVGEYFLKTIQGPDDYTFNTIGPTALNNGALLQTKTVPIAAGEVLLVWEDKKDNSDGDFNDVIFKAYSVPEPSTVGALLGVGVLGLFNLRRRNSRNKG